MKGKTSYDNRFHIPYKPFNVYIRPGYKLAINATMININFLHTSVHKDLSIVVGHFPKSKCFSQTSGVELSLY